MKEIKPLTALRGIFALWVVGFHLGAWAQVAGSDRIPIVSRGYLAVDFFFLLSGFILADANCGPFVGGYSPRAHLGFVVKRAGRLFPLHWVVLVASMALIAANGQQQYWWSYIVAEAALIHRWGIGYAPVGAINGPDWSISTEWAANLVFPLFVGLTLATSRRLAAIVGGACCALLVYGAWCHGWSLDIATSHGFLPLMRCFAEFATGMLIYRWRDRLQALKSDAAVLALLAAGLALLFLPASDLAVVAIMVALLGGLAGNAGQVKRWLSVKPLHWFGEVSYSIYLVQIPVLLVVQKVAFLIQDETLRLWSYVLGTFVAVLGIAHCTHKLVEAPARDWSKSFVRRYFGSAKSEKPKQVFT